MDLGKLLVRLLVGGLMTAHGLQKLRGVFGGPGIEGATGMMESLGMRPARQNALAVSWVETAGGAAIAAGAGTPFAAAAVIASQAVAIQKVHGKNGPWSSKGGWEYNAVLIAALTAIAEAPGAISFDALVGRSRWGVAGALIALGGGVVGAYAVLEAAKRGGVANLRTPQSTDDAAEGATADSADAAI